MTQEEKLYIIKIIRQETACGLMEASVSFDKLIEALKHKPSTIMDKTQVIKIIWE